MPLYGKHYRRRLRMPLPDRGIERGDLLRQISKWKPLLDNPELLMMKQLFSMPASEPFLLHLVDVVWQEAHEDQSVPSTEWAKKMIAKARRTFEEAKDG
jgi:hypothetical protein